MFAFGIQNNMGKATILYIQTIGLQWLLRIMNSENPTNEYYY
jgi:hypothetical protein